MCKKILVEHNFNIKCPIVSVQLRLSLAEHTHVRSTKTRKQCDQPPPHRKLPRLPVSSHPSSGPTHKASTVPPLSPKISVARICMLD